MKSPGMESRFRCLDINECESNELRVCDNEKFSCRNVPGSYTCFCEDGFKLEGGECKGETKSD